MITFGLGVEPMYINRSLALDLDSPFPDLLLLLVWPREKEWLSLDQKYVHYKPDSKLIAFADNMNKVAPDYGFEAKNLVFDSRSVACEL